jgi:hypothetical protein
MAIITLVSQTNTPSALLELSPDYVLCDEKAPSL